MKVASQLRREVNALFHEIDEQELECWRKLGRLKVLRQRASDMDARLDMGAGSGDELDNFGVLDDEVRHNN